MYLARKEKKHYGYYYDACDASDYESGIYYENNLLFSESYQNSERFSTTMEILTVTAADSE